MDFNIAVIEESQRRVDGQKANPSVNYHEEEDRGDHGEDQAAAFPSHHCFDEPQQAFDDDFTEVLEPSRHQFSPPGAKNEDAHQNDAGDPGREECVGYDEPGAPVGAFVYQVFFVVAKGGLALRFLFVFGVEETLVVVPLALGSHHLGREMDGGLGDEGTLGGLTGRFVGIGLYQTGAYSSGDQASYEKRRHYQQAHYQEPAVHWVLSPLAPGFWLVGWLPSNGRTILYSP